MKERETGQDMSEIVNVDFDAWTNADHEDFEDYVGKPFEDAYRGRAYIDEETGEKAVDNRGRALKRVQLSKKAITATVWIERRRENPQFTINDARVMRQNDMVFNVVGDDGDPKSPPPKPAAKKRTSSGPRSAATTE